MSVKTRIEAIEAKTAGVGHLDIAEMLRAVRERMKGNAPQGQEDASLRVRRKAHRTDLASRLAAAKERIERLRLEELGKAEAAESAQADECGAVYSEKDARDLPLARETAAG